VRTLVPVTVPLIVHDPPDTHARSTKPLQSGVAVSAKLRLVYTDPTTGLSAPDAQFVTPRVAGLVEVVGSCRTVYLTYEVENLEPGCIHEGTIDVYVAFISNTASGIPELGQMKVSAGFAPGPNVTTSEPILRNALRICAPQCGLLFPFVTTLGGFETRITIANTSLDPFGTTPQHGSVFLSFYGSSGGMGVPPVRCETERIQAGHTLVFNVSIGGRGVPPMLGFEGYLIAITNFMYCHALAFIAKGGDGPGHTYPAVHIPRGTGQLPEPPLGS